MYERAGSMEEATKRLCLPDADRILVFYVITTDRCEESRFRKATYSGAPLELSLSISDDFNYSW
jgi:hypothetical protein